MRDNGILQHICKKVTRLYPEEEPAVSISLQLTRDELLEASRCTKLPALSDDEQPNPPETVMELNLMNTWTTRQSIFGSSNS